MNNNVLMDKEDLEKCKKIEKHLKSVYYCQYKKCSTKAEDTIMSELYVKLFNKPIKITACSTCIYNYYKKVAKVYYETLQLQNETEPTTDNEVVADNSTQITTKKRGRKKKDEYQTKQ